MKRYVKKIVVYFCILLVVILFLYTFNITTSRYMGQSVAREEVIAVPIFNLNNNGQTYTVDNMLPGSEKEFEFLVSNYDENKTNEVLLSYNISVTTETEVPLTIKLYKDTEEGEKEIPITQGKTEEMTMNYGTQVTEKYKLKIIWNSKDNSYEYANKKIMCNVGIEATQVAE